MLRTGQARNCIMIALQHCIFSGIVSPSERMLNTSTGIIPYVVRIKRICGRLATLSRQYEMQRRSRLSLIYSRGNGAQNAQEM